MTGREPVSAAHIAVVSAAGPVNQDSQRVLLPQRAELHQRRALHREWKAADAAAVQERGSAS